MREEAEDGPGDTGFLSSLELTNLSEDLPNIDGLCRLCLEDESRIELLDVWDANPLSNTPIPKLLSEGLNIDVDHCSIEGMPRKVCTECLSELNSFANFKKRALNNDAKLRQVVSKRLKLAEAQALYGPDFFELDTTSRYPVDTSIPPLYCDTSGGDNGSDLCIPALQASENLLDINVTDLPLGLEIRVMEGTLNEDSTRSVDIHTICAESDSFTSNEITLGGVSIARSHSQVVEVESKSLHAVLASTLEDVRKDSCSQFQIEDGGDASRSIVGAAVTDSVAESPQLLSVANACSEKGSTNSLCGKSDAQGQQSATTKHPRKQNVFRNPALIPEIFAVENKINGKRLAFRCKTCKKTFNTRNNFRKHLASHVEKKGVTCKHCDKWFLSQNGLTRHERIHSGEKPFKCVLCDRTFSQKEILQRHILIHSDTKPFKCEHCDKSYTQKEALNNHNRLHHAWEFTQYPCALCDKSFCHASGLTRHMIVHTGKQVLCDFCKRGFFDRSSLKRHIKKQHPEGAT